METPGYIFIDKIQPPVAAAKPKVGKWIVQGCSRVLAIIATDSEGGPQWRGFTVAWHFLHKIIIEAPGDRNGRATALI